MSCGNFKIICDRKANELWIVADSQDTALIQALASTELFGFGSGDWVSKGTARDVMSDCGDSGRWLPFLVKDGTQKCIIELDRRAPDHVKSADFYNKVICLPTSLVKGKGVV